MPGDPDRDNRFPAGDPVVSSDFVPRETFAASLALHCLAGLNMNVTAERMGHSTKQKLEWPRRF